MELTLLLAVVLGVAAAGAALRWESRRGMGGAKGDLGDLALGAVIAGVFIGRIAAMLADGVNPLGSPGDILVVRAGVATGWASAAAIGFVAWRGRGELWRVLDGLAVASLAGLAGWHAGCVFRGGCLGSATALPWGVHQTGSGVARHPVELYAALLYVAAAVTVGWWRRSGRAPAGDAAGVALAAAGAVRLATEPLRPSLSGGPVAWYVLAVAVGLGITLWSLGLARTRASPGS